MEPGVWIKVHRKHVGTSQLMLSRVSGVERSTLNAVEAGKRPPSLLTMRKVCEAMKLALWESFYLMEKANAEDYRPDEL